MLTPDRQKLSEWSDEDLMVHSRTDDGLAAFSVLVERHQQEYLNFFRGLGVYHDAEDLVQELFLRLFRYRHRYRVKASWRTFAYRLARQVWIDRIRRRSRREAFTEKYAAQLELDAPLQNKGMENLSHEEVRMTVDRLPPAMKEVVVLSVFQGLNYTETAKVLKIPVGTVKSRMYHAVRRLHAMWHEGGADERGAERDR